ncbi:MAG: DUF4838 domain-containing protein [Lentisphaeria bacterium]|nr:DUF4838 domain-containing protein [Lentisphaeria bacterium]
MKKYAMLFLFAALLFSASAGVHKRGKATPFALKDLSISAPEEFLPAAKILSTVMEKISKEKIAVTTNGNIRFIKNTEHSPQGFSINTTGDGMIITASDLAGAKFATAFLARELGYRHFFPAPEWEVIPKKLPASISLNIAESPDYLSRSIWPGWGIWSDYRKATNFDEMWKLFNFQGGINIKCGHVYGRFIHHRKKVFEQHPEYYALYKGKRNSSKLCISNPELRKLFVDYKLERIAKKNEKSVSAEPSDGGGWCECENCRKLGSYSTRAVILANETAAAVTAKYTGHKVGIYAYNQHCLPPEVDLHPDVVVNIATAFIKGGHTIDELISGWKKRKANIGIREYYFTRTVPGSGKGSNTAYMKESLNRFYDLGARYITAEAGDYWGAGGLGFYSGAHMMWNTGLDPAELKEDFLRKAFPVSYARMKEFYSLLDGANPRPLNADLLGRMYRHLDAARKLASGAEKTRIDALICYTRYCEEYFNYSKNIKWDNYIKLLKYAASIRHLRLVHTYAMHRSPRALCPRGMRNKATGIDWMNTPAPTAAEIDRFVADGIKNNKLLAFDVKEFSNNLVRKTDTKGINTIQAGNSRRRVYFYIWCDGRPFTLTVTGGLIKHYRDRGNVILELVQVGGESDTGELETLIQTDRSVPPDGKPRKVVFKPKHPGLHKLFINDNGDMSRIVWPGTMAVARPVESESSPELNGRFFVYVPHGTKILGFYAKTTRGTLHDPSGKAVFKLAKRNGYYNFPVTEEQCGKLWRINNMYGVIKFLTVPSTLSLRSTHYLVPEETQKKGK